MYCSNCGKLLSDDAKFCSACGNKVETEEFVSQQLAQEPVAEQPVVPEPVISEPVISEPVISEPVAEQPVVSELVISEPVAEQPVVSEPVIQTAVAEQPVVSEFVQPKKKKKWKKVIAIIASVLAVLVIATVCFGKMLYFAVAPETYVGTIINNTFDELEKEADKIRKELVGVNFEKDDFTLAIDVDDGYGYDMQAKAAFSSSGEELKFEFADNDYHRVQFFTNNSTAGLNIHNDSDTFITVDSTNVLKDLRKSELLGSDMKAINLNGGNISYENLYKLLIERELDKDTQKAIKKATKELLKSSDIGNRETVEIEMDGKTVKAKEIRIEISADSYKDYVSEMMGIALRDKNVKSILGNVMEFIDTDGIEELVEEAMEDFDTDIVICLTEYNFKVVGIKIAPDIGDDDKASVALSFKSKKLINHMEFVVESEYRGDYYEYSDKVVITSKGNHIPQKGVFTDETKIENLNEYVFKGEKEVQSSAVSHIAVLDFKNGNAEGKIRNETTFEDGSKSKDVIKYKGECSNDDGFYLEINEVDTGYDIWKGSVALRITEGAERLFDHKDTVKLRDMSMYEIQDYFSW